MLEILRKSWAFISLLLIFALLATLVFSYAGAANGNGSIGHEPGHDLILYHPKPLAVSPSGRRQAIRPQPGARPARPEACAGGGHVRGQAGGGVCWPARGALGGSGGRVRMWFPGSLGSANGVGKVCRGRIM